MKLNKEEIVDYVNKAKKGDKDAFLKLYLDNVNQVHYVCLRFVKNYEDAQDVTQETFLTAMEKIETLQHSETFPTWVNHIAANKCKNILLKNNQVFLEDLNDDNNLTVLEEVATEFIPEEYINNKEKRTEIMNIIENELSDVQRMVIILYYYREESVADIAKILECSEGTVKSRLNSARQIIKKYIESKEKKGYPILGVAPFVLSAIFAEEAKANSIPESVSQSICSALSMKDGSNLLGLYGGTKKMAKAGFGLKLAGVCAGVAATAAAVGVAVLFMGSDNEDTIETTTTTYIESGVDGETEEVTTEVEDILKEGDVLVDNEYCKITFNGLIITEDGDVRVKLTEQNKTSNKILVMLKGGAADGIMCTMSDETYLEANQTEELNEAFAYGVHLEEAGIDAKELSVIEFVITIRDYGVNKEVYNQKHTLYPKGAAKAEKHLYSVKADDAVVLDNEMCKIVYLDKEISESGVYYLKLYIENKSDKDIRFQFDDCFVNEVFTHATHSYPDVTAGNGLYYDLSFWSLDNINISPEDVNKIEMTISGANWKGFGRIMEEKLVVNP